MLMLPVLYAHLRGPRPLPEVGNRLPGRRKSKLLNNLPQIVLLYHEVVGSTRDWIVRGFCTLESVAKKLQPVPGDPGSMAGVCIKAPLMRSVFDMDRR